MLEHNNHHKYATCWNKERRDNATLIWRLSRLVDRPTATYRQLLSYRETGMEKYLYSWLLVSLHVPL
ncbi:hypothetical protein SteCoe_26249 [Stentor coeruleus]|uniref:Uncharacterized protein n=1 Tax=Stentor coeruleus TaxID=5963 RepID=A0A1R2BDE8_9CILI|nr:hypothetical protein SteCoe_26249 [Stentor coeruleus]